MHPEPSLQCFETVGWAIWMAETC